MVKNRLLYRFFDALFCWVNCIHNQTIVIMKKQTTTNKALEAFIAHQIVESEKIKGGEDSIIIVDTNEI